MPKISTNSLSIYHKDIDKYYEISVMYNQKNHFYAVIPPEFREVVHHFSKKEIESFFIVKQTKRSFDEKYIPIIEAETESECLERMKECLKVLVDKSIVQRKVIVVFYNSKDICQYNDHRYNEKHPQIGLQFGLTYAIETSVGEKKIYSTYRSYDAFGGTNETRTELNLYNSSSIIIPDTEESREKLEQLYSNLKTLNEKMGEFTSTPEKMIGFISSDIKMLGA